MTIEETTGAGTAFALSAGLERKARPLPGGMRLTVTERCEMYDWKDECVAEEVARAVAAEREAAAERAGEFAKKWWSIHCASNKHMDTTRKAHDDFCALQSAIRARSNAVGKPTPD